MVFLGHPLFKNSLKSKKREKCETAIKITLRRNEKTIVEILQSRKGEEKARWRMYKRDTRRI